MVKIECETVSLWNEWMMVVCFGEKNPKNILIFCNFIKITGD